MKVKKRAIRIFLRIIFWLSYIFAGLNLYTNELFFFNSNIYLLRLIYPLSLFWLQIRLNNKENWIPINEYMSTSQLWFRIIPVILCIFTFIIVYINFVLFIIKYIL